MRGLLVAALLAALMVPILAVSQDSGDPEAQRFQIDIDGDSVIHVDLDGLPTDVAIDDLAIGERRELTTDSGRDISIERDENAIRVRVDDKDISVLSMATSGSNSHFTHRVGSSGELTERSLLLVAGRLLDPTEREALQAAVLATGLVDSVNIVPGDDAGQAHVRIVKSASVR